MCGLCRRTSLFPYPGSKMKLMKRVIPLLPQHKHYVSVFGGSGADIIFKGRAAIESFNEIDGQISNLFRVIREGRVKELLAMVEATPSHSQNTFDEALEIVKKDSGDEVKQAWAILVCTHQGFCHSHPKRMSKSSWGFNGKPGKDRSNWINLPSVILMVRRRFQKVQLLQADWSVVIEKCDSPETLFFLDPPYYPETIKKRLYAHVMTADDHRRMLETLKGIEGFAVLCGYRNELYDDLLAKWKRYDIPVKTKLSMKGQSSPRTECLWLNYDRHDNKL